MQHEHPASAFFYLASTRCLLVGETSPHKVAKCIHRVMMQRVTFAEHGLSPAHLIEQKTLQGNAVKVRSGLIRHGNDDGLAVGFAA
ncbi:hypothetical protein BYI23_E002060 (plasmid) [Burkholderia sp. YI23]|nr:hypothetical protein BYI23_E002060 [Burkholderia sp. YI23]